MEISLFTLHFVLRNRWKQAVTNKSQLTVIWAVKKFNVFQNFSEKRKQTIFAFDRIPYKKYKKTIQSDFYMTPIYSPWPQNTSKLSILLHLYNVYQGRMKYDPAIIQLKNLVNFQAKTINGKNVNTYWIDFIQYFIEYRANKANVTKSALYHLKVLQIGRKTISCQIFLSNMMWFSGFSLISWYS